jgi:hypothetical protein
MEIDSDKLFEHAIRDGIRAGIEKKFTDYNSPLDHLLKAAIETHAPKFRSLLEESISTCVLNEEFRQEIRTAVHRNLAKTLIQRFGGEIEKQVNVLKSDPTTRARITLAIEEIVKTQPH